MCGPPLTASARRSMPQMSQLQTGVVLPRRAMLPLKAFLDSSGKSCRKEDKDE